MTTHEQPDPDTQQCGGCLFWRRADGFEGECHLHAPAVFSVDCNFGRRRPKTLWPLTSAGDWCGDFVRRER